MKILADYHTHTIYSHGKGTIEDNVKVAISKGIETLGISDHSYGHLTYGVKRDDIFKMREEIDILNEKYKNILEKNKSICALIKLLYLLKYTKSHYFLENI